MALLSRQDAIHLLASLDPPLWFWRHSAAVAEVAAWLARRAKAVGLPVEGSVVEGAALLHDVDKLLPPGEPAARLPHGEGTAAWLERQGLARLGGPARWHPVTRLAAVDAPTWLRHGPLEEWIVAYADKRAEQRLVSLEERFAGWRRRYPHEDPALTGLLLARAEELETRLCRRLGIQPAEVRRLRWVRRPDDRRLGARR
jgi:hypothetical protein